MPITLHLTAGDGAGLQVGIKLEFPDEDALRRALQQTAPLFLAQARTGEVYLNTMDWKIGVAKVQRTEEGARRMESR
jgi:hypothetical protein